MYIPVTYNIVGVGDSHHHPTGEPFSVCFGESKKETTVGNNEYQTIPEPTRKLRGTKDPWPFVHSLAKKPETAMIHQ